jgi:glycosyltransferase XagB
MNHHPIISANQHYSQLAKKHGYQFVTIDAKTIDQNLFQSGRRYDYLQLSAIPIAQKKHELVIATSNPSKANLLKIQALFGKNIELVVTTAQNINQILADFFSQEYAIEIAEELHEQNPAISAKKTFNRWQKIVLTFLALFLVSALIVAPKGVAFWANFTMIFIVLVVWVYKFIFSLIGLTIPKSHKHSDLEQDDQNLPVYSVLVAIYHEHENTLQYLIHGLEKFNYPKEKLDVKLLLEADDLKTQRALSKLELPFYIETLIVPQGKPKTKPRALNFGLKFARGEYVTVYDAEDRPDPNQLKKALKKFETSDKKLACVQGRLNYYNSKENLLTRLFTLEYTFLFDLILPGLGYAKLPIPLGGTSNHFRTEFARKIGAWDPYNVTEDADLGVRINRAGYHSTVIDSTTYEESPISLHNWFNERVRWTKGYMQTYLVHMRNPFKLLRELGLKGFLSFQIFVGGGPAAKLSTLTLWITFFAFLLLPHRYTDFLYNGWLFQVGFFNLVSGYIFIVAVHFLASLRRHLYKFLPLVVLGPIYWLFISAASYVALYQLFVKPNYWGKTEHGVSKKVL